MTAAETPDAFSERDKAILRHVQGTLPDSATPYADIARAVGSSEEEVLSLLTRLTATGVIRRFGATLRHQKAGYQANVMVAWQVPEDDVDRLGPVMAARPEVSHCYHRATCPQWPYNLYTMVHGRTPGDCRAVVEAISRDSGITDYAMLTSVKELKKVSMRYF